MLRLLIMLFVPFLLVFAVSAQDDAPEPTITYGFAPGVYIAVPTDWSSDFRDGAMSATNGNTVVFAYAPSRFPDGTPADTPAEELTRVFEHFNPDGYRISDPETLDVSGRTIAYTDYVILQRGGNQLRVRFMIVPFADGRYGAIAALVDAGSPDLMWHVFEPIVASFVFSSTATIPVPEGFEYREIYHDWGMSIPGDMRFLPNDRWRYRGENDDLTLILYPPHYARNARRLWSTAESSPSCTTVFTVLASMYAAASPRNIFDAVEYESLGDHPTPLTLNDGREALSITFSLVDGDYTGDALFLVIPSADGECAMFVAYPMGDQTLDALQQQIITIVSTFNVGDR